MNTKTVFCKKLQKEGQALEKPPLPGALGQDIHENICKEAWGLWLTQQTVLINEHRLNLLDPKARTFLQEEMRKFFFESTYVTPSGFIAPKDKEGS